MLYKRYDNRTLLAGLLIFLTLFLEAQMIAPGQRAKNTLKQKSTVQKVTCNTSKNTIITNFPSGSKFNIYFSAINI